MEKCKANFFDKEYVPKSLEELYNSGWREYILYHIRKYSLHDVNHSPEDLLQDMMLQMAKTNYVENFDPEVSEFIMYLHAFIHNFMSKPYHREHSTVHGEKIVNHASLVPTTGDISEGSEGNVISHESVASVESNFADAVCLIHSLESDLSRIKTDSKVEYKDIVVTKDPMTVYKLLSAGYNVNEIAEIFGTSKQFVYTLRQRILRLVESYI